MTRKEFCEKLQLERLGKGLGTFEVTKRMSAPSCVVGCVESGKKNFNMKVLLQYIFAIEKALVLNNKRIYSYNELVDLFRSQSEKCLSQEYFAQSCNTSQDTIEKIEQMQSPMSVDIFLNMCNAFNIKISVEKYRREKSNKRIRGQYLSFYWNEIKKHGHIILIFISIPILIYLYFLFIMYVAEIKCETLAGDIFCTFFWLFLVGWPLVLFGKKN